MDAEKKEADQVEDNISLDRFFLGGIGRKTMTFFAVVMIIMVVLFGVIFFEMSRAKESFMSESKDFINLSLNEDRQTMESLSKELLKTDAVHVADDIIYFLGQNPKMNISQLEKNDVMKSMAVRKVGVTGYTAVHDRNGINHFHPNPAIVGTDLHDIAAEYPEFGAIFERSLYEASEGSYRWKDADGVVRDKYMYCMPVESTTFIVCATTYLDEFFLPELKSETMMKDYLDGVRKGIDSIFQTLFLLFGGAIMILICSTAIIIIFVQRRISLPLHQLHDAAKNLEKGDFKARTDINTGDEFEKLGESFNKTAEALGMLDDERKQLDRAKTEFLSITSHELRSPMTPMRAQMQMLLKGYYGKLSAKQKEAIDIVLRNTERLDNVIMDLLEISRIEAARLKFNFIKADLTEYIKRLMEEMKGFVPEKKIEFVLNVGKLPVIEVDPDRVMQVLRNLTNNAAKFSKEKGKILINVEQKGEFINFRVRDFGEGMSQADQMRLFEPFYQVGHSETFSREFGGTGLGLAICKGIVESQNGRIGVRSEIGKGSIFFFTMPLTPVKEMKPIKMLFSSKEMMDERVKKVFKDILGPIGDDEFEELRGKGVTMDNASGYLKFLEGRHILHEDELDRFRKALLTAFEEYTPEGKARLAAEEGIEEDISGIFR